jgi:N-carbamoyl-L-amino-acid hydrolase
LAGSLDASVDDTLRDQSGKTLKHVRSEAGFGADLVQVRIPAGQYASFVELHIEQGPILEREKFSIGVVTAIAAPASLRITIEGEGGHAGAVLMPDRRDALCAAAELILAVETAAKATGAIDTVATTGICDVFPSAVNSVPSRVQLEVDIRDIDGDRRQFVLAELEQAAQVICRRRGMRHELHIVNADAPGTCDPGIVEAIGKACADLKLAHKHMVSRAYHDSLFMSRIAPTGMIFIPCRAGVSHRPDEYASPEAIADGTRVLAETLAQLAS